MDETISNNLFLLAAAYFCLLLLSAFFSGTETAMFFSNRLRIRGLAKKGNKKAQIVANFQENPENFLSVVLVGNNIVNILLATTSAYIFYVFFGESGIWLSSIVTTIVVLIFGEITPKSLAANMPERAALFIVPLMNIIYKILHPVVKYLTLLIGAILKMLGVRKRRQKKITGEEIQSMFALAQEEGVLNKETAALYKNIWSISEIICREIMIPKSQVVALDADSGFKQCVDTVKEFKYSRFPVFEGQTDNIIGIVHAKDIMDFWGEEEGFGLKKIIRAPLFVPDIIYIDEIFELLKKNRVHMGCVVDEYGNFEGIVTMEDILEEIVGEIKDEHDFDEEIMLRAVDDKTFLVSGNTAIRNVNKVLGLELPDEENTIAGFIFYLLGKVPEKEEEIAYENLIFKVKSIKGNRIKRVVIKKTLTQ